jgi:hypothetical protein
MGRVSRVFASLGLVAALQGGALLGVAPAFASDDEGSGERDAPAYNPDFESGDVAGVIYKIEGDDRTQVVTIYNTDVGLAVKAFVKAPALLAQIKNKSVCVGRFVTAHGIRTGDTTIEVEGFDVDLTTQCSTPPK